MYILEDEALNELLGGEFYQTIVAKQQEPKISVYKLFKSFQFNYKSYLGFLNFYKKHLSPIVDDIKVVDDNSLTAKVIRWLAR